MPHSVMRTAGGRLAFDLPPRELRDALADPGTKLWVDIDSTSRHRQSSWIELRHDLVDRSTG